eukprot:13718004-Alexandrium_andersonii.AAC.1
MVLGELPRQDEKLDAVERAVHEAPGLVGDPEDMGRGLRGLHRPAPLHGRSDQAVARAGGLLRDQ